jgi:hypothetical protein
MREESFGRQRLGINLVMGQWVDIFTEGLVRPIYETIRNWSWVGDTTTFTFVFILFALFASHFTGSLATLQVLRGRVRNGGP